MSSAWRFEVKENKVNNLKRLLLINIYILHVRNAKLKKKKII